MSARERKLHATSDLPTCERGSLACMGLLVANGLRRVRLRVRNRERVWVANRVRVRVRVRVTNRVRLRVRNWVRVKIRHEVSGEGDRLG